MVKLFRIFIFIHIIIAFGACDKPKTNRIPLRDFFKAPEKSIFRISPNGEYISYLKPYKDKLNLFIKTIANGDEKMVTSFTDYSIRGDYFWTYNNEIIFFQENIGLDEYKVYSVDVPTLSVKLLLSQEKVFIYPIGKNKNEPDIVNIRMNKRDPANFDIYRLNVKTGDLSLYLKNSGNITQWYPDDDGKIRLVRESDGVNESILFRPNDKSPFKSIIQNSFKTMVVPIAFTGEEEYFYAISNVNRDKMALVEINARDGKEKRVIYSSDNVDIQNVEYTKAKHRLELLSWQDPNIPKYYLNKYIKFIYNKIAEKLPGGNEINIIDRDTAEKRFIVASSNDRNPGSYYLFVKDSAKIVKLGDVNSALKSEELCSMQPVSFKASDGMTIGGYLTLPRGQRKTNLPLIVMVHDGPFNQRYWWVYNPEVQFLANRGYAVFQVNFRGSTGFGKSFHNAGFKEVGGKIQQDITDGVHWLIKNKTANPKKIAIFGPGFGGFSALYGISFHPELYNCAIVQHSLINFFTYIKDGPPYLKAYVNMTYEMIGDPEKDALQLKAISPVFHTDKIKAPLLIFQGEKDLRANISELNQFVRVLQKQNGNENVKYFLKSNERTVFRSEENRMEMYTEIESFLDKNMRIK